MSERSLCTHAGHVGPELVPLRGEITAHGLPLRAQLLEARSKFRSILSTS